jgi:hypothetical protein
MTYREEMSRLAHALGRLLTDGGTVAASDIPAAVAGHASTVALLSELHADLTGAAPGPHWQTVTELERHPVGLLGRVLSHQPRVTDQPFSQVLQALPAGPAGRHWREVAKAATLAQYDWQRAAPQTRPTGDAAWSELADVAHLAEAIAVLDGDIADSLSAAGRLKEASDFRQAGRSGLRVVAREVRELASTGFLPEGPEVRATRHTRVLITTDPAELPASLRRLDDLVVGAHNITPVQVSMVSRVLAESASTAARTIEEIGASGPAKALRQQAAQLAEASGLTRRVIALAPGETSVGTQAQVIHDLLTRLQRRGNTLTADVARAVADAVPTLTTSLTMAAEHQLRTERWLIPVEGVAGQAWGPRRETDEAPALLQALRQASPQVSGSDHAVIQQPQAITQSPVPPRVALEKPLHKRSAWTRSPSPGMPRTGPILGR